jgi:hypothetical protein
VAQFSTSIESIAASATSAAASSTGGKAAAGAELDDQLRPRTHRLEDDSRQVVVDVAAVAGEVAQRLGERQVRRACPRRARSQASALNRVSVNASGSRSGVNSFMNRPEAPPRRRGRLFGRRGAGWQERREGAVAAANHRGPGQISAGNGPATTLFSRPLLP